MTKIQEKTKQNQSVFWILVHKALDKNDGQIFCLPVEDVNKNRVSFVSYMNRILGAPFIKKIWAS